MTPEPQPTKDGTCPWCESQIYGLAGLYQNRHTKCAECESEIVIDGIADTDLTIYPNEPELNLP